MYLWLFLSPWWSGKQQQLSLAASSYLLRNDIGKFLSFLALMENSPPGPSVITLKGRMNCLPGSALLTTTAYGQMEQKEKQCHESWNCSVKRNVREPDFKDTDLDIDFGDGHLSGRLPLELTAGHFVCSFQSDHKLTLGDGVNGHQDVSTANISDDAIANSFGARHFYKNNLFDIQWGWTAPARHRDYQVCWSVWVFRGGQDNNSILDVKFERSVPDDFNDFFKF